MNTSQSESAVAWWNGQFVPPSTLSVSVFDAGFIQGLTVTEQLRTFGGQPFRLRQHMDRLFHSLSIVGIDPGFDRRELERVVQEVAGRNHPLLAADDDLGVALWVTPGPYAKFASIAPPGPVVCCHAHPLDFGAWASKYRDGIRLVTSGHRQVSSQNWPPELKCRSRMHYYLADKEAQSQDPSAQALLLDLDGFVCETSTANVLAVLPDEGLVSPRKAGILPGISLAVVDELASQLELPLTYRDIRPEELKSASEVLVCSTSGCLLPVASLDGVAASPVPGPVCQRLTVAWNELAGINIQHQARKYSDRPMW